MDKGAAKAERGTPAPRGVQLGRVDLNIPLPTYLYALCRLIQIETKRSQKLISWHTVSPQ